MRKLPVKTTLLRVCALALGVPVLLTLPAYTHIEDTPRNAITPENFFRNEGEVLSALAAVYAQLRATEWGYYNLSQISADENIVPTRGQDWYDNGRWLEIERQAWAPNSPSGLDDINAAWVDAFTGVVRANALIANIEGVSLPSKDTVRAEIRVLRAFYYYQLMDLFGGVPLVTDTELKTRPKNTRAEIFNFIETELKASRAILPRSRPASQHGRITRGAADAILANMYLNAGVFSKDAGVNATAYNSCAGVQIGGVSACQPAINHAGSVLNAGG